MSRTFVLILLDGLGDRSYAELGGKTPLQAACTPFLDELAGMGCNGLFHASFQGQALPSENAHFAMFGYKAEDFPGRGALEAMGAGIDLAANDVAVLANLVQLAEEDGCLKFVREKVNVDQPQFDQTFKKIARFSFEGVEIRLIPYKKSFAVILLQGDVSPFITDSNPIIEGRCLLQISPWKNFSTHEPSIRTARVLNDYLIWAYKTLSLNSPSGMNTDPGAPMLNGLVTQRAGRLKKVVPFQEKFGLNGASISTGAIYAGLCKYLEIEHVKGRENNDPGEEMKLRVLQAQELISTHDFIHIHSKAPDEAGHSKDPMLKKQAIENLDKGLAQSVPELLKRKDIVLAVTADHSTPCSGVMVHSGEPVPLCILGPGVRKDHVKKFDEVSAGAGGLGFVHGPEFMYMVLNYLDRGKLVGLMDTPVDQPYWPGQSKPLKIRHIDLF